MAHPVVHAEIRSVDPDATRTFFSALGVFADAQGHNVGVAANG